LDAALLELDADQVELERVEPERVEHLVELGLEQRAAFLGRLDEAFEVVGQQQDLRLGGHGAPPFVTGRAAVQTRPLLRRTITGVMSSRYSALHALSAQRARFSAPPLLKARGPPG